MFEFNERAIRAYQRVGFVLEGRARQSIRREDHWWDELAMSMLDTDWQQLQAERAGEPDAPPSTDEAPPPTLLEPTSRLHRVMERLR